MLDFELFAAYLSERFQEYMSDDIQLKTVTIRNTDETIVIKVSDLRGNMVVDINQFYKPYQVDEDLEACANILAGTLTMAIKQQKTIERNELHEKFNENHIALVPKKANEKAFDDENIARPIINDETLPFTYQMMMFDKHSTLIGFTPIKNSDMTFYDSLMPYLYVKAKNNTVDLLNITCKSYAEIKEDTELYEELSELKELEEIRPKNLDSLHLISVDLNDFAPILNLETSTYRKLSEKLSSDLVLMFSGGGQHIYIIPYTDKGSLDTYIEFLAKGLDMYFYDRDEDVVYNITDIEDKK